MRGDKVEILVDVGDGVRAFEIVATKDGRRVEVVHTRNSVEVTEVTRTGKEIRTAQFMASRVVAVIEHPAAEEEHRRPRRAPPGQEPLGSEGSHAWRASLP